jgi:hypothetical protein
MKKLIDVSEVTLEEWTRYFSTLYNRDNKHDEYFPSTQMIINDSKIELTNAEVLKALKNRKSPASDGIYNELLKYGGEILAEKINMLFNKILYNHQIHQEWRISILTPLFKKDDKSNLENYRGINLLYRTLKLSTKILTIKLNERIELADEQQGFRSGRSCIDAIFILWQVIEKSLESINRLFYFLCIYRKHSIESNLKTLNKFYTRNKYWCI